MPDTGKLILTLRMLAHSALGPSALTMQERQHLIAAAALLDQVFTRVDEVEVTAGKQVLRGYIPELACIEPGDEFIITFFVNPDHRVTEAAFKYRPAEWASWSLPIGAYNRSPQ